MINNINPGSNKDYDGDDMDGVYDEFEASDNQKVVSEEPTEDQKRFYLSQYPRDIAQKEEWFPSESKSTNKEEKKKSKSDKDNATEYYVQKYSDNNVLAESILIDKRPVFLISEVGKDGQVSIKIKDSIISGDKVLKPLESISYVNKAYSFNSEEEIEECVVRAKLETPDSLYGKIKPIWKKYVEADNFHSTICAVDTFFTYLQDKLGLTHYLFFVGNPGSGKSNNLTVFQQLAYRNITTTDISHYNIYQYFGNLDEGVGTLCEDEADNIDEDNEKMKIYKNGYISGRPVLKTDTTYGRKQFKYNTFGWKAFAAERLPDSSKARGFNERIIEIPCFNGFPTHDISEVINPAGEEKFQQLLDELNDTKNLLLMYRLLHYHEKIPDIKTNLKGREKQLFKPVLRIFQNSKTLEELLPVISKYVSEKREHNANTLYAFLYRIIKEMIKKNGSLEIPSTSIWDTITEALPGSFIPNKPLSYESAEFGPFSQKSIVEALIQVFGAKASQNRRDGRKLIFNPEKLERLGRTYDLSIKVKVGLDDSGTNVTDVTDVGLDKHLLDIGTNEQIVDNDNKDCNFDNKTNVIYEKTIINNLLNKDSVPIYPSQVSHPSPKEVE